MVPSAAAETTEGTRASWLRSRMTTGAPSFTKATRLFVVPRSIPTTLDMLTPGAPFPRSRSRGDLPLDPGEQVADVVALEHALAQRFEHGTPIRGGRVAIDEGVPLRRQRRELRFVRRLLRVDGPAGSFEPRLQLIGRRPRRAHRPDFVELLVEGEHFLEERRGNLL